MYESALAQRGVPSKWVPLGDVLECIKNGDGESLYSAAVADPHVLRVRADQYSLPANSFDIGPGTIAFIVNNDFDAYAWVVTQALNTIGAVQPNSAQALRSANNKWISHVAFREAGLPVPEAALVREFTQLENAGHVLGFPLVLKELEGAQGTGVRLARTMSELIACAEELELHRQPLMLEHYIEMGAIDRRVVTVEGQFAAAMERHAKSGDFRANIAQGGHGESCEVSDEQLELVRRATQALKLRFVGMDIGVVKEVLPEREYLPQDSTFLIEANPMPGLAGLKSATGVDASQLVVDTLLAQAEIADRSVS
jgi:RimK family alpha-L-glutamate ligase